MIIEQNENTCLMIKLLAFLLIISLCASFFAFSASASSSVSWDNQPVYSGPAISANSDLASVGTHIADYVVPRPYSSYAVVDSSRSSSNVYFAFSDLDESSGYRRVTARFASSSNFYIVVASPEGSSFNYVSSSYSSDYGIYSYSKTFPIASPDYPDGTVSDSCFGPFFASREDCFSALADVCENGIPPVTEPRTLNLTLPAGNVAYIELPSSGSIPFSASTTSALDHSTPWTGSNQTWGFSSSLPNSSFTLPLSGTSPFSWSGSGRNTIFGTYRSWSYSANVSGSQYLVVCNPAFPTDTPENQAINGPITISVGSALQYKVYSLDTEWRNGALVGESSDTTFTGNWDDTSGTWTTTNDLTGEPDTPQAGGNNIASESSKNINDWLQSIANSISGFFNGAIGAVTTLVSSASDFVRSISGLYSWLPSPVYSVLISALIIAITIGVIKVFI